MRWRKAIAATGKYGRERQEKDRPRTAADRDSSDHGLRLHPEMQKRIDEWIAQQDAEGLGRREAMRRSLDYALTALLKTKRRPK
jgi:hypothetical protein